MNVLLLYFIHGACVQASPRSVYYTRIKFDVHDQVVNNHDNVKNDT